MRDKIYELDFLFAEDIENQWDSYMEKGYSIDEATTQLLDQYDEVFNKKEKVLFFITLALLQVNLECVDKRIKAEIKKLIVAKEMEQYLKGISGSKEVLMALKKRYK